MDEPMKIEMKRSITFDRLTDGGKESTAGGEEEADGFMARGLWNALNA